MKRLLLFTVMLTFFGLGSLILGFIVFPILKILSKSSKTYKIRCTKLINKSWKILVKMLEYTGIINVYTDKEILEIKNKIIVASHPTYIDILLLMAYIPNSLCVIKSSILKNCIMKNVVKSLYITNDGSVKDFLNKAKVALEEGFNLIIFPTGKRVGYGEEVHIHKGAAQLAIKSGFSIVPLKITTSEPFMTKKHSLFQLGKKTVRFDIKIQDEIVPENLKNPEITEIGLRNKICSIIKEKI